MLASSGHRKLCSLIVISTCSVTLSSSMHPTCDCFDGYRGGHVSITADCSINADAPPSEFLSMQGICTRPPSGSQVRPKLSVLVSSNAILIA